MIKFPGFIQQPDSWDFRGLPMGLCVRLMHEFSIPNRIHRGQGVLSLHDTLET